MTDKQDKLVAVAQDNLQYIWNNIQNGNYQEVRSLWSTASRYPAVAQAIGLTRQNLIWSARGYATWVQNECAQNRFSKARHLIDFINTPEYALTWTDIGLNKATVKAWADDNIRQLLSQLQDGRLEAAAYLIELVYYYPDSRRILGSDNLALVQTSAVKWANQRYQVLQDNSLDAAIRRTQAHDLAMFVALQHDREDNEVKDNPQAPVFITDGFNFTWEEVFALSQH